MPITTWKVPHDAGYSWRPSEEDKTTTYVGCVVATYTDVKRVMSDIYADVYYAIVWDVASNSFKHVEYASAFELQSRQGTAIVDASPTLAAQWTAEKKRVADERELARAAAARTALQAHLEKMHNMPTAGKRMVVCRGRKVAIGTSGVVFWLRDGRVGLRTSDRKDARGKWMDIVWVNASNLKAADPL